MKRLLFLSLALNLALGAWMGWLVARRANPLELPATATQPASRVFKRTVPPRSLPPHQTNMVDLEENFHWSQLESADFRDYTTNLRAFGCPESTVRDIITEEIDAIYQERVRGVVDEVTGKYWHYMVHAPELDKMVEAKRKELSKLEKEKDELCEALFGNSNPQRQENIAAAHMRREAALTARYSFLAADKQKALLDLESELERELLALAGQTNLTRAENAAQAKATRDKYARLRDETLSEEEKQELRLRESGARLVSQNFTGMDPDPATVRQLAAIRLEQQQAEAKLRTNGPPDRQRLRELQSDATNKIMELLGTDGFATYQRAQDYRFQQAYAVTERLGLSNGAAAAVYETQRNAEKEAERLRKDTALPDEERAAMLQALSTTARDRINSSLGESGLNAYERHAGRWLNSLTNVGK